MMISLYWTGGPLSDTMSHAYAIHLGVVPYALYGVLYAPYGMHWGLFCLASRAWFWAFDSTPVDCVCL